MQTGAQLIAAERQRQQNVLGWTREHDDQHAKGELADAARCYAEYAVMQTMGLENTMPKDGDRPEDWPWEPQWWKPSDEILRNLAKAGALIAAEMDRIIRQRALAEQASRENK